MALVSLPFLRFLGNGLFVSALDLGLTHAVDRITGHALLAVTTGFVAGLTAGYVLHVRISFAVPIVPARQVPRFIVTVAINYLLTLLVVWTTNVMLGAPTTTGKLLSLPIVALSSYLLCRRWVYKA